MKKISILVLTLCVLLISACSSKSTCLEEGTDINALFNEINEKINAGEFESGIFQDQSIDATQLNELYGINADDLEEFIVRVPLVNVSSSEIAIFHVKPDKMDLVKQGVAKRVKDLEEQWKRYLPDQYDDVKNYQTLECGNYYFMVIAKDSEKIIEFIEEK